MNRCDFLLLFICQNQTTSKHKVMHISFYNARIGRM